MAFSIFIKRNNTVEVPLFQSDFFECTLNAECKIV